jgi:iron complex outermembrane receptor protein
MVSFYRSPLHLIAAILFASTTLSVYSPAQTHAPTTSAKAVPACQASSLQPSAHLTGKVEDLTGAAIPSAAISLHCGDFHNHSLAAADGTYSITLPAGTFKVEVSASGFASTSQLLSVPATGTQQNFKLALGAVSSIVSVTAPGAYVATSATTATKSDTTLLETPQSVSVITVEQMSERAVQTIDQAVQYTPGVGVSTYGNESRFDWLNIRGFDESTYGLFRDNSRWQTGQISGQIDPYLIQEIDVIKGPSSVLYGQNTPGGLINVVTKRPTAETSNELMYNYGSCSRKQVQGDFTGPIDALGHFRYRMTGLFRDSDTQVRYVPDNRRLIAPAFTWAPSDRTTLTVLGDYQHDNTGWGQFLPSQGVLTSNPNGPIPTDTFTGEPGYDFFRRQQWSAGYLFEHHFANKWTIRQTARYSKIAFHGNDVFGGGLAADLRTLTRFDFGNSLDQDLYTADTQALSRFKTKGIEHSVLFGVDYSNSESSIKSGFASAPSIDIYNPVYGATIPALYTYFDTTQPSWQTGLYAQDHLKLGRKVVATFSGREDLTNMKTHDRIASTHVEQSPNKFTGRAAITYISDLGLAPYFSYSTSFLPTAGVDFYGKPYKPTTGEQYEGGVKYQPKHHASFVTASVFNIQQKNVQTPDSSNAMNTIQSGAVRSRGVELEGVASLFSGLDLHASYSYIDEKVTEATDGTVGKRPVLVPDQLFGITGDYTVTRGPLAGLGFGLGERFVGTAEGDAANTLELPSYSLMEASLRYTWHNMQFQVNSTNLLDKIYVPVCTSLSYCNYGSRRNVNGSVRYRWNGWSKK